MLLVSRRVLQGLYSLIFLCIVVISWGYVLYAARLAALWQLQQKYPNQVLF
ncbi:small integral membrane protein 27 [Bufo gargarizans]|uniref:small integral membrane protein 27 n=1 Tax=Bufo gargarizans TaxID=30331 RepID=UPI001CF3376A|nr:small integral membrane protein 27 [Bufo gargarizans]